MVSHCLAFKRCVNGLNDHLGEQWLVFEVANGVPTPEDI